MAAGEAAARAIDAVLAAPRGAALIELSGGAAHPLYVYESFYDTSSNIGGTVAWYYFGPAYRYVFFAIPLSFGEGPAAIDALRRAVQEIMGQPTDTDPEPNPLPSRFSLAQNYPNPFNATTTIEYALPSPGPVTITVYNLLGQTVSVWRSERQSAGRHTYHWQGLDQTGHPVATGLYLYRLESGRHTASRKMLLLK